MDFLSDAMAASGPTDLSPFAQCVVLATLHGRGIAHRQQSLVVGRGISGQEAREFWFRHERLASALEKQIKQLEESAPAVVEHDPMVLFTHMLAHNIVIDLLGTVEMNPWQTAEYRLMAFAYKEHARHAAGEVVRLSRAVPVLSCFKVRIAFPKPLLTSFLLVISLIQFPLWDIYLRPPLGSPLPTYYACLWRIFSLDTC
jgi:hypothetical protein